jgi:hypothetical protein
MMKNLRYNQNKPNDLGVIYNEMKQTKQKKANQIMKGTKMNQDNIFLMGVSKIK